MFLCPFFGGILYGSAFYHHLTNEQFIFCVGMKFYKGCFCVP